MTPAKPNSVGLLKYQSDQLRARPVRAKAPLRISFAGGGTDVMPYPAEHGGCVLSATIDMYAFATAQRREDCEYHVYMGDGTNARYQKAEELVFDGNLDLVKAVVKSLSPDAGLDLHLFSDAPPGSGLGSSSAMVVAMLAAIAELNHLPMPAYELARRAYQVERLELKQAGGMQDQYAAAFGGFNFIEFNGEDRVVVNPLRIHANVLNELHGSMLLCYTGVTRESWGILERQVAGYKAKNSQSLEALKTIKGLSVEMKESLLTGHLQKFGEGLNAGWLAKRNLAQGISNDHIEKLYEKAMSAGASAGKILGAGGGGFLLIFCDFNRRPEVTRAMEEAWARIVPFHFEEQGVQTWRAP